MYVSSLICSVSNSDIRTAIEGEQLIAGLALHGRTPLLVEHVTCMCEMCMCAERVCVNEGKI